MQKFLNKKIYFFILIFISSELIFSQDSILNLKESFVKNIPTDTMDKSLDSYIWNELGEPETLNSFLKFLLKNNGFKIFKDFNFEFITFTSTENDSIKGLGISYKFDKNFSGFFSDYSNSAKVFGYDLCLNSEGNIAFKSNINPSNFINSQISINSFASFGGVTAKLKNPSDEEKNILNRFEDVLVSSEDPYKTKEWKEFSKLIKRRLTTQFYSNMGLVGGLEANQKFTKKNYTYGLQVGLDLKAWNEDDILSKVNIFDWPFAAIRFLSGIDENFTPQGSTIPTLLLNFKKVVAEGENPRKIDSTENIFPRFNIEVTFKTLVAKTMGCEAYFEAEFRYYKEINPPEIVKVKNLDKFIFFSSALKLDNGLFVSYSTGRLPFDLKDDRIYQLGFDFKF